jgi:hypothetical protein
VGALIDLGNGYKMEYQGWDNRHHPHLQSVDKAGAKIYCPHGVATIVFRISPEHDAVIAPQAEKFNVIELEPLSLTQSVHGPCGCKGHIIDGKWIKT